MELKPEAWPDWDAQNDPQKSDAGYIMPRRFDVICVHEYVPFAGVEDDFIEQLSIEWLK